ncbi:MAG: CBS domain-containing protein [Candidatus Omnitrophica bacterium]|nr:CBS domain-containing protein [Candidatus Omnitrophota bacterium]
MQVRELMTANPEACCPFDTCDLVGEIMRRRRCGFVPVVDSQTTKQVVGVVTDRDIALFLTKTPTLANQVRVEACMSRDPKVIAPDADLREAAQAMEQCAVHRLPVVDGGRLVGVLSLNDIALAARKEWSRTGVHLAEQQMKDVLEAIAAAQAAQKG